MANQTHPVVSSCSISELKNAIIVAAKTQTPLLIGGKPGCGKTQIVKATAREEGYQYTEMVLGGRDIGDVWMPYIADGGLKHHYNPALPVKGNPNFSPTSPIILNFDEVDKANRLMQSVLLKALDEWLIGEAKLMDNVIIVATMNRVWDLAGSEQLTSALANRGTVIHFDPDVDFWLDWAMGHGVHPLVLAWIKFDPSNLDEFNREAFLAGDYAYPSARSNEKLSRICHAHDSNLMSDRLFRAEVNGTIGMAKGTKFLGFVKIQSKMPNIKDILDGKKVHVPDDPSVNYAVMAALIQQGTKDNLGNICNYIDRMSPEWHLLFTTSLAKHKPALQVTAAWSKWIVEHRTTLT